MAMRIHLGMISDDKWDSLCDASHSKYPKWEDLNLWMKKYYDAVEVTDDGDFPEADEFRVYEFGTDEKYVEFCLTWL